MKTFSASGDEARLPRGPEACAIHKGEETAQGIGHQNPDEEQLM